uniref:SH2 domain containing 4Ba n=1 Tax=Cyprinus carpio TaxID=7962 RepID=A0A8C1S971_CYPCA
FIIRQEQVRCWTECESQEEVWFSQLPLSLSPENRKSVQWLQGRHGEVWVWVMGDSPGDKPYAMIVKELMEERARRQAQLEAQELGRGEAEGRRGDPTCRGKKSEGALNKNKKSEQRDKEWEEQSLFFPISPAWVRTPRPSSREMLILWFTEEQKPKQAGYERNGNDIAPWFHGIISRDDSETLLMNAAEGFFLVWVSEMIWSYTLSYSTASIFKHFLINVSRDYYGFLGVDQNRHATLEEVITTTRKELLLEACKRTGPTVDFRGISHDSSHAKDFKDGSLQGS